MVYALSLLRSDCFRLRPSASKNRLSFFRKKNSLDIFQFSLVNLHDFLFDVSRSVQFFRNTLVRILSISICFLLSTFSFMRMIVACPQYMCFVCFNIYGITVNISQIDLGMYVYFFWDWILGFDFLSHPYRCSNRFLFDDFNWNMISFFFLVGCVFSALLNRNHFKMLYRNWIKMP